LTRFRDGHRRVEVASTFIKLVLVAAKSSVNCPLIFSVKEEFVMTARPALTECRKHPLEIWRCLAFRKSIIEMCLDKGAINEVNPAVTHFHIHMPSQNQTFVVFESAVFKGNVFI